ncbi:hypothetical protein [Bacillus sp. FJAT-27231]|nr:hypothetical protein [Bacillus sp. FJAT-27231]
MNAVFEKGYLVSEWIKLQHRLGWDIKRQYALDLIPFKKRPSIRKM